MNQSEQKFLQRATEITEANLQNEQFGVNELAEKLGMSRATLHRKIKLNTKKSVSQFICQIRLKKALEMLKQNSATISEIAYSCGFNSVTYFTKCFHDHYGCSPGEAAKRDISENHESDKQENDIQSKLSRKKILIGGIILAVFLTVLLVTILIKPFQPRTLPKTIAVLPFINDSRDTTTTAILNGVLEGITGNLSKIGDLRVISRTSVEQYRTNPSKSMRQISRKLRVAYVLEGSGQIQGDRIKMHFQLIDGKRDAHLSYIDFDENFKEDILALEAKIALAVADSINANITRKEKKQILKKPTINQKALDALQQGINALYDEVDPEYNKKVTLVAEKKFRKAIMLDSTCSDAYVRLGWNLVGQEKVNDTILHLANRALNFDNKNANAYYLKGWYLLWHSQNIDEAEKAFRKTIRLNPSHSSGYSYLGDLMFVKGNYADLVKNKLEAIELERGSSRAGYLYYFSFQLYSLGFFKEGIKFSEELIKEYNDSSFYYLGLEAENMNSGNYKAAYEYSLKRGGKDNIADWWCTANILLRLKDFKGALSIVDSLDKNGGPNIKFFKKDGQVTPWHYVGYTYFKNGLKEKADFHFNGVIKEQQKIINENTGKGRGYACLTLAITYSAMGDKAKAIETMKKMLKNKDEIPISPVTMLEFRNHPMCDAIQGTSEHKEILRIAEENFQPVKKKIEEDLMKAGY